MSLPGSGNLQETSHVHKGQRARDAHEQEAGKRPKDTRASSEGERSSSGRHQETRR